MMDTRPLNVILLGIVALWMTFSWARDASAETVDEAYSNALKDYYAGKYEKAVSAFERILAIPMENEDLHFNLGCAYFRLGKLGPAIYHFEKSLLLDTQEDAKFNLKTVREMAASRVKDELKGASKQAFWVRWISSLRSSTWAILFLILWWITLGIVFGLRFISPGATRSGLIAGNSFLGIVTLVVGLSLAGRIYFDQRITTAIVLPDKLVVREGPNEATKVTFKVHAGLKVRVQGADGTWSKIRLANGLEGWVPTRQVGIL